MYLILGDIHGRTIWKDIIAKEKDFDKVIFLGDYLDPYEKLSPKQIVDNFEEILKFKQDNSDKVILLTGNHDCSYTKACDDKCRYSPFVQQIIGDKIGQLIQDNTLQLCHYLTDADIWVSHAGFTNTWLRHNRLQLNEIELNNHFKEYVQSELNNPYVFQYRNFQTDVYGDNVYQSPMWVRPYSLSIDSPYDVCQIVGHTQIENHSDEDITRVMMCDSLGYNKYYILQDMSLKHMNEWKIIQKQY